MVEFLGDWVVVGIFGLDEVKAIFCGLPAAEDVDEAVLGE